LQRDATRKITRDYTKNRAAKTLFTKELAMPLKKGASRKTVSSNIKTLVHDFERTGTIGTSAPASRKKAVKQAVAIALDKARESGGA
jgi:hypothetical protein